MPGVPFHTLLREPPGETHGFLLALQGFLDLLKLFVLFDQENLFAVRYRQHRPSVALREPARHSEGNPSRRKAAIFHGFFYRFDRQRLVLFSGRWGLVSLYKCRLEKALNFTGQEFLGTSGIP